MEKVQCAHVGPKKVCAGSFSIILNGGGEEAGETLLFLKREDFRSPSSVLGPPTVCEGKNFINANLSLHGRMEKIYEQLYVIPTL